MYTTARSPIAVPYEPSAELAELCRDLLGGSPRAYDNREPARVRLAILVAAARFVLTHLHHMRKIRLVQEHFTYTSRRLDVVALCFACNSMTSLKS